MFRSAMICFAIAVAVSLSIPRLAQADPASPKPSATDAVPTQNGFDYAAKAAGMVVETNFVSDINRDPTRLKDPAAMKEAVALLEQNAPAVATLREGLRWPYRNPPKTSADEFPSVREDAKPGASTGIHGDG